MPDIWDVNPPDQQAEQPQQQPPDIWDVNQPQPQEQKGPNQWLNIAGAAGQEANYVFGTPTNDFMAIGKTPKGEAYYGEGFGAWARKTWARMTDPTRHSDGLDYKTADAINSAAKGVADQWAKDNPNLADFKDFVYSTTNAAALDIKRIQQGGALPVALENTNNLATTAADVLVGGVMQIPSTISRALTAGGQAVEDVVNKDQPAPQNPINQFLPDGVLKNVADMSQSLSPTTNSWNLLRYAGQQVQKGDIGGALLSTVLAPIALSAGPFSKAVAGLASTSFKDAQELAIRNRDVTGANTIFTQMWDGQVKAKIQRDILDGVPPTFIEEKYANPWVEAGAGILTDPTTYVGGIIGHGAHGAKFLQDATDVTKALPEVEKLARVSLESGHSGVQAMEYLKNATGAIDKLLNGKFSDLTKLVNVNNLEHLTSSGKQFMLNRQLGSFEKFLLGQFKDPEEAIGVFKTMANYATATEDAAKAEHLTTLLSSPAGKAALSGPGVTWMGFAKKAMEVTAEDGTKTFMPVADFVDHLIANGKKGATAAEQTMNMTKYAADKMEEVTRQLFPSVTEMEKAAATVKAGGKVAEETARLAKMLEDVPDYVRKVNATLGRDSKISTIYTKFNGFFAGVYMGLSPAFAVRNVIANSVGIMADAGLGTTLDITKNALASFFDKGATYERYLNGLADMLGGQAALPTDLLSKEGLSNELKDALGALKWSGYAEHTTRVGLMYHAATEVMDNFGRNASLNPKILADAGMPAEHIGAYMAILRKNSFNVEKTMQEYSALMEKSGGAVEAWRQVKPPKMLTDFLASFGLDKQLANDLRFGEHATPESIRATIQKYRESLQSASDMALKEPVFPAEGSPEAALANLGKDVGKGIKNAAELQQAYTTGMGVFQSAREAAYTAAQKVMQDVMAQARQAGMPLPQQFSDAMQMLHSAQMEALGPEVKNGILGWQSLAADVAKKVKSGAITTDEALAQLGKKLPGEFQIDMAKYTAGLSPDMKFGDALYQHIQPQVISDWWSHFGEHQYKTVANAITLATGDPALHETVLAQARQHLRDSMDIFEQIHGFKAAGAGASELTDAQRAQGVVNDIFKAAQDAGWTRNKDILLKGINKDAKALGKAEYSVLRDVPPDEIIASIKAHGGPDLAGAVQAGDGKLNIGTTILADAHGPAQHTIPGFINKNLDGALQDLAHYEQEVLSKFNTLGSPAHTLTAEGSAALAKFNADVTEKLVHARQVAIELGRQKADFAIHAYGDKTYLDAGLSFLMPYHYWQGRTYAKWAERMVYRPDIVAAYGKYRHALETAHAGLPDWWKYNVTSDDVLGTKSDNPLFFNLESTLNPINGLTGVDFNDSKKRVDWTSRTVDDLGKFGPGLFTPLQWLVAGSLYAKGENEAATRWMGRLIPQTQQTKQLINFVGEKTGMPAPQIGSYGKYGEYDPFVNLFSGGLDPYERPRVGRAMGAMQDEQIAAIKANPALTQEQKNAQIGTLQAQFVDAANKQSGPLWDTAVQNSQAARAPGAMASYLFGVGFKNRSVSDMQVDNFYTDYYQLMASASNIAPDKFRASMSMLQQKYPWMDTVLISRKADDDRQTAYAYNVIGRIPPGQTSELFKAAGIGNDMIGRFYDSKGTFKGWTEQDISRFNAGIADLGTILALPDGNTKQEWDAVRTQYGYMTDAMKAQFGADILDKMDLYFNKTGDEQKQYIQAHPELQDAFNFKASSYASHPLLNRYYGGIENLTKYYKSQMYTALDAKYGADIQQKYDEYGNLKLTDNKAASAYWKAHPELKGYGDEKKLWDDYIMRKSVELGAKLPEGPTISMRNDFEMQPGQEDLQQAVQGQQQPTWDDFKGILSAPMQRLVMDYWIHGKNLSPDAEKNLDYAASKSGFRNADAMLQAIGISLQSQYAQP